MLLAQDNNVRAGTRDLGSLSVESYPAPGSAQDSTANTTALPLQRADLGLAYLLRPIEARYSTFAAPKLNLDSVPVSRTSQLQPLLVSIRANTSLPSHRHVRIATGSRSSIVAAPSQAQIRGRPSRVRYLPARNWFLPQSGLKTSLRSSSQPW